MAVNTKTDYMHSSNIVTTLQKYKKLSRNIRNHQSLIEDKTVILCTAAFLDNKDLVVIDLCLDIIEHLIQNYNTHQALISTFGIFEALESLSIRLRNSADIQGNRAAVMVDVLRKSAPPAYSTRLRTKRKHVRKTTTMYQLYMPNLTSVNRQDVEDILVEIKGLVSFVVDIEQQKCTVRVTPNVPIKTIIGLIMERCGLKALVVTRNPEEMTEIYVDILNKSSSFNAEYFPEEDTPPKDKCVSNITNLTKNAGHWIKSATNFWSKSFYW